MASRRSFIGRSASAIGAVALRYVLPVAAVLGRCLTNLQRYRKPPFMRINLLRNFVRRQ